MMAYDVYEHFAYENRALPLELSMGWALQLATETARIDEAAQNGPVRLSLRAICCRIQKGHCVRLSLAGSCFPAYSINPGTRGDAGETKLIDQRIITLFVASGTDFPSRLLLPRFD
jgi:predicted acyl esterase